MMSVVFRSNPLPTTGAIYVTNPRTIPVRDNGRKRRFVYGKVFGKTPSRLNDVQNRKIIDIMMGRAGTAAQKKKAQAAKAEYEKHVQGKGGKLSGNSSAVKFVKSIQGKTDAFISRVTGASKKKSTKASSSAKRKASLKRSDFDRSTMKSLLGAVAKRNKSGFTKLVKKHLPKATASQINDFYLKLKTMNNPLERRTEMAIVLNNPKKKKAKSRKSASKRVMSWKAFVKKHMKAGKTMKQVAALWKKYKKEHGISSAAPIKKAAPAKKKASSKKSSAKNKTTLGKKKASSKRMSWQSLVKKHGVMGAKKLYKKPRSVKNPEEELEFDEMDILENPRKKGKKAGSRRKSSAWSRLVKKHGVLGAKELYSKPSKSKGKKRHSGTKKRGVKLTDARKQKIYRDLRRQATGRTSLDLATQLAHLNDAVVDLAVIEALHDASCGSFSSCAKRYITETHGWHSPTKRDGSYRFGTWTDLDKEITKLQKVRELKDSGVTPGAAIREEAIKAAKAREELRKKRQKEVFDLFKDAKRPEVETEPSKTEVETEPPRSNPRRRRNYDLYDMRSQLDYGMSRQQDMVDSSAGFQPFEAMSGLLDGIESSFAQIPVVGMAAPYIRPLGLGAATAGVSYLVGRWLGPEIQKVEFFKNADKFGYTIVGATTMATIKIAQHMGWFKSESADQIAMLSVVAGAFVDTLDYLREQSSAPAMSGIAMGDGGQFYLAQQAPAHRGMMPLPAPQLHGSAGNDYAGVVGSLSGAACAAGSAQGAHGYGALMYTGAGY